MAVDHYENFPVASLLLPRELRAAVRDIYRYARTADDIADEGEVSNHERLRALREFRHALDQIDAALKIGKLIQAGESIHRPDIFIPLQQTMWRHDLPSSLFHDLLSAFEQDVVKHRYEDDGELMEYCRHSANPVGRLLLHLYKRHDEKNVAYSDAICTGLQLTNFWQDVALDWRKGRVYLPRDKCQGHGLHEDWIARCTHAGRLLQSGSDAPQSRAWRSLMQEQVAQARTMLRSGRPLTSRVPLRAGLELRLVIQGGLRILQRLEHLNYDVFQRRPVLRPVDWAHMALNIFAK